MHFEEKGAYTGEVSGEMLKAINVEYVIIGHSERRQYYNETDESVNKKIKAAFKNGLKPIVCVGETLEQREAGETEKIVTNQIAKAFEGISSENLENIIVAYEPIWAIGTGFIPTEKEIKDTTQYIKNIVWQLFDVSISVLYGGSVNEKNVQSLNQIDVVDGFLVGGASTKPKELLKMYEVVVS